MYSPTSFHPLLYFILCISLHSIHSSYCCISHLAFVGDPKKGPQMSCGSLRNVTCISDIVWKHLSVPYGGEKKKTRKNGKRKKKSPQPNSTLEELKYVHSEYPESLANCLICCQFHMWKCCQYRCTNSFHFISISCFFCFFVNTTCNYVPFTAGGISGYL